jgi:mRNA interferase MazF
VSGSRRSEAGARGRGYTPDRGDAIWLDFDPQTGREQSGRRPALVISPASYNGLVGLAIVCPITNQVKGYPFEVQIPEGVAVAGVVLADQVKSLDWKKRRAKLIASVPRSVVRDVLAKARTLLAE